MIVWGMGHLLMTNTIEALRRRLNSNLAVKIWNTAMPVPVWIACNYIQVR